MSIPSNLGPVSDLTIALRDFVRTHDAFRKDGRIAGDEPEYITKLRAALAGLFLPQKLSLSDVITLLDDATAVTVDSSEVIYPEVRTEEGEDHFMVLDLTTGTLRFACDKNAIVPVEEGALVLMATDGQLYRIRCLRVYSPVMAP